MRTISLQFKLLCTRIDTQYNQHLQKITIFTDELIPVNISQRVANKITAFCHNYRRVYRRSYTRRYFTESCEQNYSFLPQLSTGIPTAVYPLVFHIELQTKLQPFAIITNGYTDGHIPVGISQRVARKLRHSSIITDRYTDRHTIITDVYTDAFSDGWRTIRSTRLSEFTDGFADRRGKTNTRVFWRTISNGFQKYGGIFQIFARESIKYRRNLMPPPKKIIIICSVGNFVGNIVL